MIYFIADLHLSAQQPQISQPFFHFLVNEAKQADALYILGDLFDFWIGDDEQSAFIDEVKTALNALSASGVKLYFQHGNRDFLIGERFTREAGMQLLGDYAFLSLYGVPTLLCHGDTLCIDDVKYQQFRRKVHQKWRQRLFLCLPLRWRVAIANRIRAKSGADKAQKSAQIMDVNPDFVAQKMAEFGATQLIHGHTHRQAVHSETDFTRIVLGDWRPHRASILQLDETGFRFIETAS